MINTSSESFHQTCNIGRREPSYLVCDPLALVTAGTGLVIRTMDQTSFSNTLVADNRWRHKVDEG